MVVVKRVEPFKVHLEPWPGGSVGWSIVPYTKRLQVQFPVRAHTQVVGLISGQGAHRRQPTDVSLSH